jgi:thioredoxin reductase
MKRALEGAVTLKQAEIRSVNSEQLTDNSYILTSSTGMQYAAKTVIIATFPTAPPATARFLKAKKSLLWAEGTPPAMRRSTFHA